MIPKIIHQVWEGRNESMPDLQSQMSKTWQKHYPEWQYEFWTGEKMDSFVRKNFPEFADIYFNYRYDIQRWNVIRYLILYKMGGLYVDLDYECIEPFDYLLIGKTCCFGMEPADHAKTQGRSHIVSNAIIASSVGHPFLKCLIERLFEISLFENNLVAYVQESTGSLFVTDTYNMYTHKEEIFLLPSALISPLSRNDVQLYLRDCIDKNTLEIKLHEAVAVHYFLGSWHELDNSKTDVLYLSVSNGNGGAARAAYRIHCGLLDAGVNSMMLVKTATDEKRNVIVASSEKQKRRNKQNYLQDYSVAPDSYFVPASTHGIHLQKYIELFDPDIIQLHWINNDFIRLEDLKDIKKKIVWRFPDCWPMTGGCHYIGECTNYMYYCGKCPQLNSDNKNDLSHKIWLRKYNSFKNVDMAIVVPSIWLKNIAKKSSLFRERKIEIIPNGLDIGLFSPLDKKSARKILNLPLDKKIILFGAFLAIQDKRKGFLLFMQALQQLAEKQGDEYEAIVFGADKNDLSIDLPLRFLGILRDHLTLQMIYSAADVMVVPSMQEAFGQTVIEAMACAVPVVTFANTGTSGIIDHQQNGYLAQFGDVKDLAKGIQWVLEDDFRRKILAKNARETVLLRYDIRLVAQQYIQLYENLRI